MAEQQPPTLLVVEDEPFIRMMAADYLEDMGCRPLAASNAAEALRMLGDHGAVDLLFTDVNMPGDMDGIALAECVHGLHPGTEIIVTSGKRIISEDTLPDDGSFLRKPYDYGDLKRLLGQKLSGLPWRDA